MIDLSDPTQWNLITRRNLSSIDDKPLPAQSFVAGSNQLFVGIKVEDKPTWKFGGYLTQYIPQLVSSTNDLFPALTQIQRYPLVCRSYQAIALTNATPKTYVCQVQFPPWFRICILEVYQRNDP
jgi:hypothetical protein